MESVSFTIRNCLSEISRDEQVSSLIAGMTAPRKHISSVCFYDATSSKLLEQTCRNIILPVRKNGCSTGWHQRFFSNTGWRNIIEFGSGDNS